MISFEYHTKGRHISANIQLTTDFWAYIISHKERIVMTDQLHLFETPPIEPLEQEVIARVEDIRKSVKYMLSSSRRWTGLLARATLARSIRGSNSIEGYNVSVSDAIAAVAGEEPTEANQEVWLAVTHYRQAMTYILNLADDLHFSYDESLIRGLHYM